MRLLRWSQNYATGIDAIDADHRILMDTINRLHDGLDAEEGKRTEASFFEELYGAIERHLGYEEAIMRTLAQMGFDRHEEDHDRMREEIRDLTEGVSDAEEIDCVELTLRLDARFARHFKAYDRESETQNGPNRAR